MASKLPVLWIDPSHVAALARHERLSCNTFARNYEEPGFVEYLPANRCKTCRFFEPEFPAACSYWQGSVKQDGSGYCSEHREAMVAGGIGAPHHEV